MPPPFKSKTLALLLAALLGALGIHRFYLRGGGDRWGWAHLAAVPLCAAIFMSSGDRPLMLAAAPLLLSGLIALIEGLVLGLMPDEKWDEAFNAGRAEKSNSGSLHALLLVLTAGFGAIAGIAALARALDLLLTGGAYG